MKCYICNQSFMPGLTPSRCPACGYPIKKLMDIIGEKGIVRSETHIKAIAFFKKHIRNGGWFELKQIGRMHYLYGRVRQDDVKRSLYIGRI